VDGRAGEADAPRRSRRERALVPGIAAARRVVIRIAVAVGVLVVGVVRVVRVVEVVGVLRILGVLGVAVFVAVRAGAAAAAAATTTTASASAAAGATTTTGNSTGATTSATSASAGSATVTTTVGRRGGRVVPSRSTVRRGNTRRGPLGRRRAWLGGQGEGGGKEARDEDQKEQERRGHPTLNHNFPGEGKAGTAGQSAQKPCPRRGSSAVVGAMSAAQSSCPPTR